VLDDVVVHGNAPSVVGTWARECAASPEERRQWAGRLRRRWRGATRDRWPSSLSSRIPPSSPARISRRRAEY